MYCAVVVVPLRPPNPLGVETMVEDWLCQAAGERYPVLEILRDAARQDAAFVNRGLPGGDPSLIIVPPMEQYRTRYVFLTPDKYMFDFIAVMAPREATVLLDGNPLDSYGCSISPADGRNEEERGKPLPDHVVYRCQLSFPVIDPSLPSPDNVMPGSQNDGVHRVDADSPVMVLAYGFDSYVSYGYAAGTQLEMIGPAK